METKGNIAEWLKRRASLNVDDVCIIPAKLAGEIADYIEKLEKEIKPLVSLRHFAIDQIKEDIYEDWRGNYVLVSEVEKLFKAANVPTNITIEHVTEQKTNYVMQNNYKKVESMVVSNQNKSALEKARLEFEEWDQWSDNTKNAKIKEMQKFTELDNKCFDDSICGLNGVYCILCVSSNIKT
jgi:hypothetical protein